VLDGPDMIEAMELWDQPNPFERDEWMQESESEAESFVEIDPAPEKDWVSSRYRLHQIGVTIMQYPKEDVREIDEWTEEGGLADYVAEYSWRMDAKAEEAAGKLGQ
jgi:hypothetical protein